jgi:uncharacterized MAPEG superfamily protein
MPRRRWIGSVGCATRGGMTPEQWALGGAVALGIVHLSADSFSFKAQVGNAYTMGPRDEGKARQGLAGRLHRAARNYTENLAMFVAVVVLVQSTQTVDPLSQWGAGLWLGARTAYLPAYASGVPWVRTICWQVAMVGLILMLVAVGLTR